MSQIIQQIFHLKKKLSGTGSIFDYSPNSLWPKFQFQFQFQFQINIWDVDIKA